MQLRYQKPNVIQSNRSWFQQNFLKFDKICTKIQNSKIISTKITQMQLLYQKNLTYSRKIEVGFNKIFKI